MLRFLTLLFSLVLVLPLSAGSQHPRINDSVRPLQMVSLVDFTTRTQEYRNICTVSSINAALHLWLTAAHCVIEDGGQRLHLTIDGHPVFLVKADLKADLAVLFTATHSLPALRLASRAPTWEDAIRVFGHAWGWQGLTIVEGRVANPDVSIEEAGEGFAESYMMYSANTAPGHSGSPVVDTRGEVVSVHQIGVSRGPVGGSTYARLKAFAGEYFQR